MTAITRPSDGGGIVGAVTAYRLSEAGVLTLPIDAEEPGRGTSASSLAWLDSARKHRRAYHDPSMAAILATRRSRRRSGIPSPKGGSMSRHCPTAAGLESAAGALAASASGD